MRYFIAERKPANRFCTVTLAMPVALGMATVVIALVRTEMSWQLLLVQSFIDIHGQSY